MLYQRTIAKRVSVTGIGLHSGKKVTLTLNPAPADSGIVFKRVDLKDATELKASFDTVGTTENATTLGSGANVVHTVEHFLAVLYGYGINNVYCEIDGPEVPIMDGSGVSFSFVIKETGVADLNSPKKFIVITEPVRIEVGDKWAQIEPSSKLVIDSTIVFPHNVIKTQQKTFEFSCENFITDICRARTFGFLKDVDYLKRRGLIKGGSLDNAVLLDDYKVINPDGLRFQDEFIRHKILDAVGDLSLLGFEIAGKVTTYKSGHNLHNLLCRQLMETESAYKIVSSSELTQEDLVPFQLPRAMAPSFL